MSIYVYFKRKQEHGVFLPNFETSHEEPKVDESEKRRIHSLEEGECIFGGKFYMSSDLTYIECFHFRVSNINGCIKEEMLENYTLPRYGI